MKKIFLVVPVYLFLISFSSSAQTSVTAGPEQKIKAVMRIPEAVKPGSTFTVKIEITKGSISGLGRFQQYLPKGMSASPVETGGADFTFENQTVKFIWLNLPEKETVSVIYSVSTESTMNTTKTISGTFSYVENGRTKTHSLLPKEIKMDINAPVEEAVAAETESKLEPPKGEAAPVMVEAPVENTSPPAEETKAESPAPAENKSPAENVITQQTIVIPEQKREEKTAPEGNDAAAKIKEMIAANKTPAPPVKALTDETKTSGIIFRVQIAAMNEKRYRRDGHFQKAFSIEETVYKEEHDGLKKYTVGNCTSYKAARTLRNAITPHVEGAFVVAYSDGARIPVGDAFALMKKQ